MYYLENNRKIKVDLANKLQLKADLGSTPTGKSSGENKDVLYASLSLGVLVLLLSLYLLYRHFASKKSLKNKTD
jgi:hypothetical protein